MRWRRRAVPSSSRSVWALPTGDGATVRVSGATRRRRDGSALQVLVEAVSFDVPAGQSVALLGPPGSGNATLVNLMAGLDRPDAGAIIVDDVAVHDLTPDEAARYRRRIGLVTRRQVPLAGLRAIENVIAPVAPYRAEFDRMARARQLLDMTGLGDRAWARPADPGTGAHPAHRAWLRLPQRSAAVVSLSRCCRAATSACSQSQKARTAGSPRRPSG